MMNDVLDLYGADRERDMNDELLDAYFLDHDPMDDEVDHERASSEDEQPEPSLRSHATDKVSSSKFTISTKDSAKTGKRGKAYEPLKDEGKVYRYEDDPKRYMQIRK